MRSQSMRAFLLAALLSACSTAQELQTMSSGTHVLDSQQLGFSTMLTVRDIQVSESFYTKHFGFKVTERLNSLRRLERTGATLYLVLTSPPTSDKPNVTLAPPSDSSRPQVNLIFRVKDVLQTHKALAAGGLVFLTPPQQPAWGGWRCFAQDPDGYLIEIEQP